ncbi:MAG: DUF5309 domain-containing protein [Candidatus Scalindua sp.]|nr:DUF5309 domain-containing protein [Candidatus Scalindua sp.]
MANTGQTTTYDVLEKVIDYSSKFLAPRELPRGLFDAISTGSTLKAPDFHWWEKKQRPRTSDLTAGYTAGAFAFVVASTLPYTIGSVVGVAGVSYKVTAINTGTKTLTVALLDGTDANAAIGVAVDVLSNANIEGSTDNLSERMPKIKGENVTQIMRETAKVSNTMMVTDKEAGAQEMTEQVGDIISQFRYNLARQLWSGYKVAPADNTGTRIAGGVPLYVKTNGYAPSGAVLSGDNLSAFVQYIYETQGGTPRELWMNPATQALISKFDASYLRRDADSNLRGTYATRFVTLNGIEVEIKTDVDILTSEIYALNSSDVSFRPLRSLTSSPLGKVGDYTEVEVVAEVSIEVNPSNQMGVFTIS